MEIAGSIQAKPVKKNCSASKDHGSGDAGIRQHVQERAAHIHIVLAARNEQQRRRAIHQHAPQQQRP